MKAEQYEARIESLNHEITYQRDRLKDERAENARLRDQLDAGKTTEIQLLGTDYIGTSPIVLKGAFYPSITDQTVVSDNGVRIQSPGGLLVRFADRSGRVGFFIHADVPFSSTVRDGGAK